MANRFKTGSKTKYGQEPLSTGYSSSTKTDFHLPPVGIEDVDLAMFELFDKELPIHVSATDNTNLKRVPVIFAGGEKWAQLKKNKPLRDKNNSLILPLITIGRTSVNQTSSEDIAGRGINQRTGEIVVRRRLSSSDRDYQKIINRIGVANQTNVFKSNRQDNGPFTLSPVEDLLNTPDVQDGLMYPIDKKRHIIETISMPSPQFLTIMYEVIIWTQYTHHMNQVMETLMSSYLPQVQGWKLDTPKGYWFVAEVEEGSLSPETNFDDMSQGERLIKQKFNVKVPAYIFASQAPGVPIPVKRYLSMPKISFETGVSSNQSSLQNPTSSTPVSVEPFLGIDDPTLPMEISRTQRSDLRSSRSGRLNYDPDNPNINDPALEKIPRGRQLDRYAKITTVNEGGKKDIRYVKIKNVNKSTGETTYVSNFDLSEVNAIENDE